LGRSVQEVFGFRAHYLSLLKKENKMISNKKVLGAVVVASALAPMLAFADYSTTTAVANILTVITDTGAVIGGVIVAILGLYTALTGLGWGLKKFRKYVSGRKF